MSSGPVPPRSSPPASEVPNGSHPATPGWPGRRHYLLLALFLSAVAVCGSLVPFRYAPLDFHEAIEQAGEILARSVRIGSRTNFVANILLFVPISYCFLGTFALDRRNRALTILCVALVLLACAAFSVAIVSTQLWFDRRVHSLSDVLAQAIGDAAGDVLWLTIGQTVTDWVRSCTVMRRPKDQIDWLLRAYFIGLLIYSVLPLNLTINPVKLVHKYREGEICLVPFSDVGWEFAALYGLFRDVVIFIPVGMLAATWLTSPRRPVRPMSTSLLLGGMIVLAIELAQLLVYSRYTATGDLVTGTFGVWVGAWVMRRWRGRTQEPQPEPVSSGVARRVWLWLGVAGVYAVLLAVVFCATSWQPLDLTVDKQQIRARFNGFFCVPFASLYQTSEFNAISQVLKKVLFYMPLGALFVLAVAPLAVPRAIRRILLAVLLLAAAGVAAAIETAQVLLPPHVPDITDVILCTAGAAIGMFVTLQLVDAPRAVETVGQPQD